RDAARDHGVRACLPSRPDQRRRPGALHRARRGRLRAGTPLPQPAEIAGADHAGRVDPPLIGKGRKARQRRDESQGVTAPFPPEQGPGRPDPRYAGLTMVASISARGNAASALRYYDHLQRDDYYSRDGEPPGRWAGRGAERLSLVGPVTHADFDAALQGLDPKTGERLAQVGGRGREHSAGWDMTFSPPKSVSVLWALSAGHDRERIEQAHRSAVLTATAHLEATAGWARRGRGGASRERTAGLLMAQFDHHASRESDPQLHTHAFIFNLAPRCDGSW